MYCLSMLHIGSSSTVYTYCTTDIQPHFNRLDQGLLNYKNSITDCSPRQFEEYLRVYFKKAVSWWELHFKCNDL